MLKGFKLLIWDDVELFGHHLEMPGKLSKSAAKMHLSFKLLEDILVVEECMGEKAIQSPHYGVEVLSGALIDRNSGGENLGVLDCKGGGVERVNHVVHG
jgi:hypothetical protein